MLNFPRKYFDSILVFMFRNLKIDLKNGRFSGNTVKDWRESSLKNYRFLLSAASKIN
jgi:hypothetical protein